MSTNHPVSLRLENLSKRSTWDMEIKTNECGLEFRIEVQSFFPGVKVNVSKDRRWLCEFRVNTWDIDEKVQVCVDVNNFMFTEECKADEKEKILELIWEILFYRSCNTTCDFFSLQLKNKADKPDIQSWMARKNISQKIFNPTTFTDYFFIKDKGTLKNPNFIVTTTQILGCLFNRNFI